MFASLTAAPEQCGAWIDLAAKSAHRGAALPDLLIAATAERHGVTVLHCDHEYDLIASVTGQVMRWVRPRGTAEH